MKHAILISLILIAGCYRPPSPTPGPSPTPTPAGIEAAASRGMRAYPDNIARVYEQLAADLRAGRFESANKFGDELERRAAECREQTFAEFRASWGSSENWSAESDAVKCEQSAKGFRR